MDSNSCWELRLSSRRMFGLPACVHKIEETDKLQQKGDEVLRI